MVPPELEPLASPPESLPVVEPESEAPPLPLPESLVPPPAPPSPVPPLACGGAHVPAAHVCEQQSAKPPHGWPLGLHWTDWHLPVVQEWLQQSEAVLHAVPSLAHAGGAQAPPVQDPLQQELLPWHAWPSGAHVVLTHCPPLHALLQHWLARWHDAPIPAHAPPPPHVPSTHDWLQQSENSLHALPGEAHPVEAPLLPPPVASGAYGDHPVPRESVVPWLVHPPNRTRAAIAIAARNDNGRAFMRSPRRSGLGRGATVSNARTPPVTP